MLVASRISPVLKTVDYSLKLRCSARMKTKNLSPSASGVCICAHQTGCTLFGLSVNRVQAKSLSRVQRKVSVSQSLTSSYFSSS